MVAPLHVFPTYSDIAQKFKIKSEYPDVIGAIDSCHIPVKVPADQQDSYLNRKFFTRLFCKEYVLQNEYSKTFVGFPESAHNARVLRYSFLHKSVEQFGAQKYFYGKYHLVGHSAYPYQTWLMTLYKDNGKLLKRQKQHNKGLSRVLVELQQHTAKQERLLTDKDVPKSLQGCNYNIQMALFRAQNSSKKEFLKVESVIANLKQ